MSSSWKQFVHTKNLNYIKRSPTVRSYTALDAFVHTDACHLQCNNNNSCSLPNVMRKNCTPKPSPRVVMQRCPKTVMLGCPPAAASTKCNWGRCHPTPERLEPPTKSVAEFIRPSNPIIRQLEPYDAPGSVITQKCRLKLADK